MTWLFYFDSAHWTPERIRAYLRAVPQDRMLLLDYYAEDVELWRRTESFFGQPFLWCYLGNFGGNTMLAGNFHETSRRLEAALDAQSGNSLSGIGATLEAFGVNRFMYEFVLEKAWDTGLTDRPGWTLWPTVMPGSTTPCCGRPGRHWPTAFTWSRPGSGRAR